MWNPIRVGCPECEKEIVIRRVGVNANGTLRMDGICLTTECLAHTERKMISFETSFASLIAEAAVNDANHHLGVN